MLERQLGHSRLVWATVLAGIVAAFTADWAWADEARGPPVTPTASEDPPTFLLRWTPIELRIPDIFAGSAGLWLLLPGGVRYRAGIAGDLGLGLGGVRFAIGPGFTRPETAREPGWSVAVQGFVHRTWPGWTPYLLTSTTYAGLEISAGYVMYRCSLGAMRANGNPGGDDWRFVGGIGIGLP